MANTIQFIDKDFVQKFWGHIKAIPESSSYSVGYEKDGKDESATDTIINHLVQLYANSNTLLNDVIIPTTGSYDGLTVTNTDGNVVVTLDMSNYTKNNKNTIVNALKGKNGYVDVDSTYNSATGEVETITIKLTAEVINDINNLLQSVSVADGGYLSGDGKATTPITLKSDLVTKATTAYKNAHTTDTEIDNLATSAYVDSQIGTYAGVTSVTTTDSDLSVNKDADNKVTVSLANGNSIQSSLNTKIDAANVVATGKYVVVTKSTNTDGTVNIKYSIKPSMVEGNMNDKLASKGYADDVLSKLTNVVEVDGGKDETLTHDDVKFKKSGTEHKYYVTLTSNNGSVTNIELDASSFVTDKYLMNVARKSEDETSADYDILVFTWHNANGTTSTTEISLTSLINGYSVGNGVVLGEATALDGGGTSRTISLKIDEADTYLEFDANGGLKIKDDRVKLGTDTSKNSLTTQGYVDKKFDEITKYNIGGGLVVKENYIYTPTDEYISKGPEVLNVKPKTNGGVDVDADGVSVKTKSGDYVVLESTSNSLNIDKAKVTQMTEGDDAARAILGGDWRIPTKEEMEELLANCSISRTNVKNIEKNVDIPGYRFTSKINQASIFLPAVGESGHYGDGPDHNFFAAYMISTLGYYLLCIEGYTQPYPPHDYHSGSKGINSFGATGNRGVGLSVRPVSYVEGVDLGLPSGLKWASSNLSNEGFVANDYDYGDFFAYGETTSRASRKVWSTSGYNNNAVYNDEYRTADEYNRSNYKFYVRENADYTIVYSKYNETDGLTVLELGSVEAPNTSSTKLSTQGYVDTRLGEFENNLTTYVSGAGMTVKDGASANEKEFELNLGTSNKYLELSGDKLQLKDGSLEKTTKTSTDTEKAYLATQGYVDYMLASNADKHEKVVWNDAQADTNFPY